MSNVTFQAHQGSIWRLSWAHPEFGQIIAACSFDNCVSIWEEGIALVKRLGFLIQILDASSEKWVRQQE